VVAFVGMGLSVAGCVAVGVVLGILGDNQFHTAPWLLIVGLVLGVACAGASVTAQVRRYL
jgi:F0F1-type ATP synthase assembly protein I